MKETLRASREEHSLRETDTNRSSNRFIRLLWNIAGTFFLGLGMIGIVLPLLPTTPFLLLAAACFIRGSKKMHEWMFNNRLFGKYLSDYIEGKGISKRAKITALVILWITIGISAFFFIDILLVQIVLFAVAVAVSVHIINLKPRKDLM